MNCKNSGNVLIIGQVPPPTHGSSLMNSLLINILEHNHYSIESINKNYNSNVEQIGKFNKRKIVTFFRLMSALTKSIKVIKHKNVIFFFSTSFPSLISDFSILLSLKLRNVKIIGYMHTYGYLKLAPNRLSRQFLIFCLNRMDKIVVLSEECKMELLHYGILPKITVIPNTLSLPYEQSEQIEDSSVMKKKLFFLSNLMPEKGIEDFICFAYYLTKKDESFSFYVGGTTTDSNYLDFLNAKISEYKLENNLHFLGHLNVNEKIKLMKECDYLIFTSKLHEAQPLVILESFSQGTPVISYNVGAIKDVIVDSYNGYLVEPGDYNRMIKLVLDSIHNNEGYARLAGNARKTYESQFSSQMFVSNWQKILRE